MFEISGIMHEQAEFEKRDAMRAQERPAQEESGGGIRLSDARMFDEMCIDFVSKINHSPN